MREPTRKTSSRKSLEASTADLLLGLGQLIRRLRSETSSGELSWSQASALARLDKLGPMTTADLARAESVKPQSMAALLAELEQDGCVARSPHPTDGRQILFALTPQGLEVRRQRGIAKRAWLLAAMERLEPLVKRLGDS